ncbi:MAG: DUF5320 domain-containing protein [Planctomycetes bacterium]|nr:DUF5320 domain-containing protein [Planctomycetota bacterium]
MPGGNGTGPAGMGPMTGRGAGYCAGYSVPGYANSVGGRGFFGFGRGVGRGRGFIGRGFGWARGGYGSPAFGVAAYGQVPFNQTATPQQEVDGLKNQAKYLEDALNGIKDRIAELADKE